MIERILLRACGLLGIACMLFLTSCQSIGPEQIYLDRSRYNDAIADTQDKQLLNNIVRSRYMHQISVLQITNVIAAYTLTPSVSGSLDITKFPLSQRGYSNSRFGSVTPGLQYSDQPTITYMPVGDAAFIRKMLIPIQTRFLALLVEGGMHDPHLLFSITIKRINEMDNAYNSSRLHLLSPSHRIRFHHLASLLDKLSVKKGVALVKAKVNRHTTIAIHFPKKFYLSPEAKEIKKMLHIPQQYQDIILFYKKVPLPNVAVIYTRSILGTLIFLSNGVQVPDAHVQEGIVRQYTSPDHKLYNWNPLMDHIMQIHTSKTLPTNAYLGTHMYGYWYYIERGDIRSISTFIYLNTLHTLSTGEEFRNMGFTIFSEQSRRNDDGVRSGSLKKHERKSQSQKKNDSDTSDTKATKSTHSQAKSS